MPAASPPASRPPTSGYRDPNGLNPVGYVYTAQGFEFDYIGIISGRDMRWDLATNGWIGDPSHSHDAIR